MASIELYRGKLREVNLEVRNLLREHQIPFGVANKPSTTGIVLLRTPAGDFEGPYKIERFCVGIGAQVLQDHGISSSQYDQ